MIYIILFKFPFEFNENPLNIFKKKEACKQHYNDY